MTRFALRGGMRFQKEHNTVFSPHPILARYHWMRGELDQDRALIKVVDCRR